MLLWQADELCTAHNAHSWPMKWLICCLSIPSCPLRLFSRVPVVHGLEGKGSLCKVPNAQESRSPIKDVSAFKVFSLYLNILVVLQ